MECIDVGSNTVQSLRPILGPYRFVRAVPYTKYVAMLNNHNTHNTPPLKPSLSLSHSNSFSTVHFHYSCVVLCCAVWNRSIPFPFPFPFLPSAILFQKSVTPLPVCMCMKLHRFHRYNLVSCSGVGREGN